MRKIVIRFCNSIRHFSNEINKRGGVDSFLWRVLGFIREMRVVQNHSISNQENTLFQLKLFSHGDCNADVRLKYISDMDLNLKSLNLQ